MVSCPDLGFVTIHSSVTLGAFRSWAPTDADPEAALRTFLDALIVTPDPRTRVDPLSDSDLEVLATHCARVMKLEAAFREARRGSPIGAAFALAVRTSPEWRQLQTAFEEIRMIIPRMNVDLGPSLARITAPLLAKDLRLPDYSGVLEVCKELTGGLNRSAELVRGWAAEYKEMVAGVQRSIVEAKTLVFDVKLIAPPDPVAGAFNTRMEHVVSAAAAINDAYRALADATSTIGNTPALDRLRPLVDLTGRGIGVVSDHFARFGAPSPFESIPGDAPTLERLVGLETRLERSEAAVQHGASQLSGNVTELIGAIVAGVKSELQGELDVFRSIVDRRTRVASAEGFLALLKEFGHFLISNHLEIFWRDDGRLRECPEAVAKGFLSTFMYGWTDKLGFVGVELASGPGYIDVLVSVFDIQRIVELKVIGEGGQSIGWGKSGVGQAAGYMSTRGCGDAFLLLFDGRRTEKGEQLLPRYETSAGTVHTSVIRIPPPGRGSRT